ncbi:hypothetical protein DACRYDRAFT_91671 [Dacryopinax primogenitus]|uniref:Uncharacterized protein n=1 Tax=Dacryopinax primogenitus (strain DJM 731) TaxID=1858805 RepID=M5G0P8_DACPD|nr:uncharacterized protein DACRYDRAFT_91671 [Dacryopinax primogenitus]EJT97377.1 hypothetical protein DACRYDRAFT_91671 [Dacryopinax primogenitus]
MIDWEDQNYVAEVAKMKSVHADASSGTDVEGMRNWVIRTRTSRKPLAKRFRTEVKVGYEDVEVKAEITLSVYIVLSCLRRRRVGFGQH